MKKRYHGDGDSSPVERESVEQELLGSADRVVTTSRDEVSELVALGADPDRVVTIPCGVDHQLFKPHGPAEPKHAEHRILFAGRLVKRKGLADVIAALPAIPDTELIIAGGPPASQLEIDNDVAALSQLASDLGVGDGPARGRLDRLSLPRIVRSADLLVAAAHYEPFGISVLEAMASGVPVVVTAVGGHLDSVVHGQTGLYTPPNDPSVLADTVNELLGNPHKRQQLGENAVRRTEKLFGWNRVADLTVSVYREVIAARRHTADASSLIGS